MTLALGLCAALRAGPTPLFSNAGFSGASATIDFNTIANETAITTQYSSQGVVFGGGLFGMTSPGDLGQFPGNGGGVIASDWLYSVGTPTLPWTATFSVPQTQVGFLLEVNAFDTTQISTFFNGTLTGTVSYQSVSDTAVFFGVQDLSGFNSISVTVTGTSNHFLAMDNFQFQSIPEPSTALLLGPGLLVLGLGRARRRYFHDRPHA